MRYLLLLLPALALAQPSGIAVRTAASGPTQTVICGTVDPLMSYSISVQADGVEINDTNGTLFPGADTDTSRGDTKTKGTERCLTIGHEAYGLTAAGKRVSRAHQLDKDHTLTWGGTVFNWHTSTLLKNNSYSKPHRVGADGQFVIPDFDYTDGTECFIDAYTGVKICKWDLARQEIRDFNLPFTSIASSTNWTNPSNSLSDSDSSASATYSGTTQDWLQYFINIPGPTSQLGETVELDWFGLVFKGLCDTNCLMDAQMSFDHGQTWSQTFQVTMPTSTGTVETFGLNGATGKAGIGWFPGKVPLRHKYAFTDGYLYNSGLSTTANFRVDADCDKVEAGTYVYTRVNSVPTKEYKVISKDCVSSPHSMVLHSAVDLSGTGIDGLGYPWMVNVGWADNAGLTFRVRKNSTGAGTITLQYAGLDMGASGQTGSSSGGMSEHCNKNLTSHGNRLCTTTDRLFALNPTTGQVTYNGYGYLSCGGSNAAVYGTYNTWSTVSATRAIGQAIHSSDGKYTVNIVDFNHDDSIAGPGYPISGIVQLAHTCVDLFPSTSLGDFIHDTYDANFNPLLYGCGVTGVIPNAAGTGDAFVSFCTRAGQDHYTYAAVIDIGNGLPVGSGGTAAVVAGFYLNQGACSVATDYCMEAYAYHTYFPLDDAPGWVAFQQALPKNQGLGSQPFYVTLQNYCTNPPTCNMWSPGMPDAAQGDLMQVQITTSWNPANGTQPTAYVTGDPLSDCYPSGCVNTTGIDGDYYHGPLRLGATLCRGYYQTECMHVTQIISPTQIELSRGYGTVGDSHYDPTSWSSGDKMYLQSAQPGLAAIAWHWSASANGSDPTAFIGCFVPGGGHSIVKNDWCAGSPDQTTVMLPSGLGSVATQFIKSTDSNAVSISRAATFAGVDGGVFGECTEGHLSNLFEWTSGLFMDVDMHPLIGGHGNTKSCFNGAIDSNPAVHVSGPIWKFTGLSLHPKIFPRLIGFGDRKGINITGTGAMLTTATSDYNKFCQPLVAGQCWAGSTTNEIYFSSPQLNPDTLISQDNSLLRDDVTIGDKANGVISLSIYTQSTPSNYTDGTAATRKGTSVLATMGLIGKPTGNTDNAKLFNSKFAFYGCWMPRPFGCIVELPSTPWDITKDYTTWAKPMLDIMPPANTASVVVEYGHGYCPDTSTDPVECDSEFPDRLLYCTGDADKCLVTSATVTDANPFTYAAQFSNPAANSISCPAGVGCSVEMPVPYGVPWYARADYYNASGTLLSSSSIQTAPTTINDSGGGGSTSPLQFSGRAPIIGGNISIQ